MKSSQNSISYIICENQIDWKTGKKVLLHKLECGDPLRMCKCLGQAVQGSKSLQDTPAVTAELY